MVHITWKLEEVEITTGDGGGGNDLPVGRFQVAAQSISEAYSDTTGLLVAVTYVLDKPHTATVVQPYTLGGTATVGSDYWKGRSETDNTQDTNYFFRVNAGSTQATHYFWIVRDTLPGAPENEDLILSLVDTITLQNGTVVNRTEVEIGTPSTHTLTIVDEDVSGDRVVSFQFSEITQPEGSGTYSINVRVIIAPEATGTETVLLSLAGGTATEGVDYDFPQATVTFGKGKTFRDIPLTVYGDPDAEGDETILLALSAPAGGAVLGTPSALTVTLQNDDAAAGGTVSLGGSPTTMQEGSQISIPVVFSGGPDHLPFDVNFGIVGVTNGPSQAAAGSDDYSYTPPSPLHFATGVETRSITLSAFADAPGVDSGNEDVQVRLVSITGPPEVTLGSPNQRVITILDAGGGGTTYDDGDLFDMNGDRLIAERTVFDFNDPHLRVYAAGTHGSTESIEIVKGFGVIPNRLQGGFHDDGDIVQCGPATSGWKQQTQSSISVAMLMLDYIWEELHGAAYPGGPETVPIGTQLEEGRIEVRGILSWNQGLLFSTYQFKPTDGFSGQRLVVNHGDTAKGIYWNSVRPANKCIRDIIIYGDKNVGFKIPTIPGMEWNNETTTHWYDNIRFEWVTQHVDGSTNSGQIFHANGGTSGDFPFPNTRRQGRVKVYDCQWVPSFNPANTFTSPPAFGQINGPLWLARCGMAAFDFRHPVQRLPWPPFWTTSEHLLYLNAPTGSVEYPALGLDVDGVTPVAANVFLNLWCPPYLSRTVSGAGNTWYYSTTRTQMQIAGRPNYLGATGKMPSGDLAIVRWDLSGHGGWHNGVSHAITIYSGWNGRVYFKDCRLFPAHPTNQSAAAVYAAHDGGYFPGNLGDINDPNHYGPQGRWRLRTEGTGVNSRTYAFQEVVIDGFQVSGNIGPTIKDAFKLNGVETVRVRKFDVKQWAHSSGGGGVPPQLALGDHDLQTGVGFYKDFDVSQLVVTNPDGTDGAAYTGGFGDYPGWQQPPGLVYGCFKHWSHAEGSNPQFNNVTLTKADIDNLPSIGAPQTNGIIAQTYKNRLASTGDGLGTVSAAAGTPPWNGQGSAFNSQSTPILPRAAWSSISRYIGEEGMVENESGKVANTDYLYLRLQTPQGGHTVNSMCDYLLHGLSTGPGSSGTLERALQWPYQEPPAGDERWEAIGPGGNWIAGLDAAASWLVDLNGTHQHFTPETPSDPTYYGHWRWLAIRWVPPGSALTTGTKVFTVGMVDSGGDGPQIELPKDSGTYVELTRVGGDTATLNIVPAVDYSVVGFVEASTTIDPGSIPDTLTIALKRKRKVVNNDAMRLNAANGFEYSSTDTGAFSGTDGLSWTGGNVTEQDEQLIITFTNKPAFASGDYINVFIDYSITNGHCQAPTDGTLHPSFNIQFDSGTTSVEWQGATTQSVNEGGSVTLTAAFNEPVGEKTIVNVQLEGDAVYGTHYTTVPGSAAGTQVFLNFEIGEQSQTLVVNTLDVPSNKLAQFRISDAGNYVVGNKDTSTVTILDTSGVQKPDAGNTGPRFATTWSVGSQNLDSGWLQANEGISHGGYVNISQSGGKWLVQRVFINGTIRCRGVGNVVFSDCEWDSGDGLVGSDYSIDGTATSNIKAEYCEMYGSVSKCVLTGGSGWELDHCDLHDVGTDCVYGGGLHMHHCYLHSFGYNVGGHADGHQVEQGGNILCEWNHVTMPYPTPPQFGAAGWVLSQMQADKANTDNVVWRNNWFDGGHISARCDGKPGMNFTNYTLRDNFFSTRFKDYAFFLEFDMGRADILVTGNRWDTDPVLVPDPALRGQLIKGSDPGGFAQE